MPAVTVAEPVMAPPLAATVTTPLPPVWTVARAAVPLPPPTVLTVMLIAVAPVLVVWIEVPPAWVKPWLPAPSWLAAMVMVLAPALRLALRAMAFWALRLTAPTVVTVALLRVMALVVMPRVPPRVPPSKVVVPVPAVWLTLPVVLTAALKVTLLALLMVMDCGSWPTAPRYRLR